MLSDDPNPEVELMRSELGAKHFILDLVKKVLTESGRRGAHNTRGPMGFAAKSGLAHRDGGMAIGGGPAGK